MIPQSAWTYIIARVRDQFPDTIFLLEGLGGKLAVTRALLNRAGFDWAYSELFQNYDRSQIEHYLPGALEITEQEGLMVHYAETHDNPRLAARSSAWARMRTALCALASRQGAFGFANGVEWLATEKIDVHNASSLNWGATENQVDAIGRLNALLREHPAFGAEGVVSLGNGGAANTLLLLRAWRSSANKLLIAANLDDQRETAVTWNPTRTGVLGSEFTDLLTGQPVTATAEGDRYTLKLPPGKVMCLTGDGDELARMQSARERFLQLPSAALSQRLQAKALEVFRQLNGLVDLGDFNLREAAVQLQRDPKAFCRQLNPEGGEPGAIQWKWPQDERRVVMLPPGHFLLVLAPVPFRARIAKDNRTIGVEDGLPAADGGFFALFAPQAAPDRHLACLLKIRLFENQGTRRISAPLLYLCRPENLRLKQRFRRRELLEHRYLFLGTNGRGAMLRACVSWGELKSRYEGLLSVNPDRDVPEDRCMLLARCRAWVVYQGYSQAIDNDCLNAFHFDYRSLGRWRFTVPTGQGQSITLTVDVQMPSGENAVVLTFHRHFGEDNPRRLEDQQPVQLILRPDIENRSFHETTKAYQGPEHRWPAAIRSLADGFVFAPDNRPALEVRVERGSFTQEPEWHYMVHRSLEAERGLDPDSDLFSPGFLHIHLTGGQKVQLTASMVGDSAAADTLPAASGTAGAAPDGLSAALTAALHHYVVRRGELKSVIAGYPWFLDWGRDSLIVVRGMVAAGMLEDARKVLQLFGQFERNGTIPNMISGKNAANRDTSDAPLWFFKACEDMLDAEGNPDFLDTAWSGRTIRSILAGMGRALVDGTPNGIRMDPDTALLFSPAHFTWMDTNHPAGTPREGYPIEIQALWYRALRLLARIDIEEHRDRWEMLAGRVRSSILERFFNPQLGHFSDCLHAKAGVPAGAAQADDALRPNQLLVLTLGATDDPKIGRSVLDACEALLVPGAIRSLADRRVARPQPIVHQGRLLNDPYHPYWGIYTGDEDTRRKPAYHNGTAWTWLFPSYCEAWAQLYGAPGRITALGWLGSSLTLINQGCIGQVPEILDGDAPHLPRGCDAQAWGVSELLRVWLRLNSVESEPVPGDS
jgi:predicted glycogen debranching enzyme